jgi:predicted TIM-barrel enzyme
MDHTELRNSLQNNRIQKMQSSNKPQMPSVSNMIYNASKSIVNNIQSVAAGNPLNMSDEGAKNRLDICKSCDFFDSVQERCAKCGCFMAVKTYLKAEKCPMGKW